MLSFYLTFDTLFNIQFLKRNLVKLKRNLVSLGRGEVALECRGRVLKVHEEFFEVTPSKVNGHPEVNLP